MNKAVEEPELCRLVFSEDRAFYRQMFSASGAYALEDLIDAEWEEILKTRVDGLADLAMTIKVLNDE